MVETPDKYLLTKEQLYQAEGGTPGMALQVFGVLLGVGSVFAASPRMSYYWKTGSLRWMEWLCLTGAASLGYATTNYAAINMLGNPVAFRSHWMAYSYVKSQNRWEGRQILGKPPMMY